MKQGFRINRDNWCDYDEVDGGKVEAGDPLYITWPDGTVTEHLAAVKVLSSSTQRASYRAYIHIQHCGASCAVRLRAMRGCVVSRTPAASVDRATAGES